ncbi:MAG: GTP 3',8-cyclase MoaA [Desulfarculus sp.]|nr:GTP 3',8-cyclase MoaA [Desulfarculus sp.]
MYDGFGRRLHYLRMSVTDRCNLNCTYCMPQQGLAKLPQGEILTLEELARVAKVAVSLGVDKIRLTGGEPLLRRDLKSLLARLSALEPRPDLRLTTNGRLLADNLAMLLEHGVSTVNISLDTLDPQRYGAITGLGVEEGARAFAQVWAGIQAALASQRLTVKVNVVLLAGVNEDQIADFARLTLAHPLAVRFIEYMPVGRQTGFIPQRFLAAEQALAIIRGLGDLHPLPARPGDGPAQRYALAGARGELGVIGALSSHFCATCNRLRLSAEGLLVPCLFSGQALDLKAILRGGGGDQDLADALRAAAAQKPRHHQQTPVDHRPSGCQMSRLGG